MYECKSAKYVEKLPKGKHSCKGLGMTAPDPSTAKDFKGIEVPLGKPVTVEGLKSDLLYNEYPFKIIFYFNIQADIISRFLAV